MKRAFSMLQALMITILLFGTATASAANEIYYDGEWHTYIGSFFNLKINNETVTAKFRLSFLTTILWFRQGTCLKSLGQRFCGMRKTKR